MKKPILILLACVILGFILVHEIRLEEIARNREAVRAEMDACRTILVHGGTDALDAYFKAKSADEQAQSFIEVLSANYAVKLVEEPAGGQNQAILTPLANPKDTANQHEWLKLPSALPNRPWTIGRAKLPDGSILYVGRIAPSQNEKSE